MLSRNNAGAEWNELNWYIHTINLCTYYTSFFLLLSRCWFFFIMKFRVFADLFHSLVCKIIFEKQLVIFFGIAFSFVGNAIINYNFKHLFFIHFAQWNIWQRIYWSEQKSYVLSWKIEFDEEYLMVMIKIRNYKARLQTKINHKSCGWCSRLFIGKLLCNAW